MKKSKANLQSIPVLINIILGYENFFWKYKITSYICNPKMMRRVGQGVKTPPFHGGVTGSIPVRGTNKDRPANNLFAGLFLLGSSRHSSCTG
jgi:hypothetical protein